VIGGRARLSIRINGGRLPHEGDKLGIRFQLRVGGEQLQGLAERLGHQQAIERVAVVQGQGFDTGGVRDALGL
jgi:hypothetical protein